MQAVQEMKLAGTIAYLQVQRSSLKLGERPRRWYDPSPLTPVVALELAADGVVGIAADGERIVDVHNRRHPESRYGNANGLSLGFTSHYALMRQRFGGRLVDGIAGENVLVRTDEAFRHAELPAELIVETGTGLARLAGARVIEPCVEFSRYALELVGPPGHDLPTPAEHDAAGRAAGGAPAPGRPDPRVMETLVFLRRGMRGYCATFAGGPNVLRVGDRLFLP